MRQVTRYTVGLFLVIAIALCTEAKGQTRYAAGTEQQPMTCRIKGKVVRILKTDKHAGGACSKHPCKALIRVIDVYGCGSSVSATPSYGDTILMSFAYTLAPTGKLFPGVRPAYMGLTKGNIFVADATQKMKIGGGHEFMVSEYERLQ